MANPQPTNPARIALLCVFSTLATPMRYVDHSEASETGVSVEKGAVVIKGGAGVMDAKNIVTPYGVATMVTQEQAEMLKRNAVFQLHEKNGFVRIETVSRAPDADNIEKIVAEMEGRDKSAPTVDADFTATGQNAPTASAA